MSESTATDFVRYFESNGIPRSEIDGRCMEPFYQRMKHSKDTAIRVDEFAVNCSINETACSDAVWAVIVETRPHPSLEMVVNQFANKLGVGIQIFHGPKNKQFIENSAIKKLIDSGQVHLTNLGLNKISPHQYNALLLNERFWQSVLGRNKILIFQTDAMLCTESPYCLKDFLGFDYIGSNWNRNRPIGIVIDGGSGGLSLRDWRLTLSCLQRFPAHRWPGGEDGYFAFHFDLMGGNVARATDCGKFSTQNKFSHESFGAHQFWKLKKPSLERFLRYCPEAAAIVDVSAI